jgi:eukaryotic-like serine/threonine-protein kinase
VAPVSGADDAGAQDFERTVQELMPALAAHADSFVRVPEQTIPRERPPMPPDERPDLDPQATPFTLGEELGRGGMGVVHVAQQTTLGRAVAIKRLKPDARGRSKADSLLHEARLTGGLEHPNIVPVYDLQSDAQGDPFIVFKLIEGTEWVGFVRDPGKLERRGIHDGLAWHLRVFDQICAAVHFAHSKGVVHGDLKPANVRVGHFGEVYVLDWGMAVRKGAYARRPDGTPRLAGTPAYMAPEMLQGGCIDERTDVYLLGATLHHVLVGRPPHKGKNFAAVMRSILASDPDVHPAVPLELADILRRSMAGDPRDRYASADALRQAVAAFVEHRGSVSLAAEAAGRLEALRDLVRAEADRALCYERFGEARFGFHQALELWPRNPAARSGLADAAEAMADYELRMGDARAAEALINAMPDPPPALRERLVEVRAAADAEVAYRAALERQAADRDLSIGWGARTVFIGVMGLLFGVGPVVRAQISELAYGPLVTGLSLYLVVAVALARRFWGPLTRTRVNRHLTAALFLGLGGTLILDLAGWAFGMPILTVLAVHLAFNATVTATLTITVERRLWPTPVLYVACYLGALAWPEAVPYITGVGNLGLAANVFVVWRPR